MEFPQKLQESAHHLRPHLIANHAYQIAKRFNEFYHSCPVIDTDEEQPRLLLVECTMQVLKISLNLLGIDAIDRM